MNIKNIAIIIFLCGGIFITPQKAAAQGTVNFQVFYDELSPYGTWINSPEYGYVWVPDVDRGFAPYATNGYWVYTNDGWTWVSNYAWGWAPFHYGRWYTDANYGSVWVPDYQWGPGWVIWRSSSNYYGWAPLRPGMSVGESNHNGYHEHNDHWTFVKHGELGRKNLHNYYVNSSKNDPIIQKSRVINTTRMDKKRNVTYNTGPGRTEVEKHSGKPISPVVVKEYSKPGQQISKNQMRIYRPKVQTGDVSGPKPTPSKVGRWEDLKNRPQKPPEATPQKTVQPVRKQTAGNRQTQPPRNKQQTRDLPRQQAHPEEQPDRNRQTQPPQNKPETKDLPRQQARPEEQPARNRLSQPQQSRPAQNVEGQQRQRHTGQPNRQLSPQPHQDKVPQNAPEEIRHKEK